MFFSVFFTVLVVHPCHDQPVTTVLTHSTFLVHDIALLCWKCRETIDMFKYQVNNCISAVFRFYS